MFALLQSLRPPRLVVIGVLIFFSAGLLRGPAGAVGNTFSIVGTLGRYGGDVSLAVGMDGLPVISYYDGVNFDLKVARCGDLACSAGNTLTVVDAAGDVGSNSSIAVGTDGLPVISYYDNNGADLKVAHCGNATCTAGNTLTIVDSAVNVGHDTSITIGSDGLPVISYRDFTGFNLKVAHCGNAACSAGNTLTTVDSPGMVGRSSSIAPGGRRPTYHHLL